MNGYYQRAIREEPGTCGGCVHFERGRLGEFISAQGRCKVKPDRWAYSQTTKACKKHYEGKEGGSGGQ